MSEILIYQTAVGQARLEVQMTVDMVWQSLNQLTELFQCDKSFISRHIKNQFEDHELEPRSVLANDATTASDGCKVERDFHSAIEATRQLEKNQKDKKP